MTKSEIQPSLNAWDQRPGETNISYAAFKVFLNLPAPRKWKEIVPAIGKSESLIRRWYNRYDWQTRARLFDAAVMGESINKTLNTLAGFRNEITAKAASDYRTMQEIWDEGMKLLQKQAQENQALDVVTLERFIKARLKLDELARRVAQMPTSYGAALELEEASGDWLLSFEGPQRLIGDGLGGISREMEDEKDQDEAE